MIWASPSPPFLNDILLPRIVLAVLSLTIIAGFAMGQGCMIAVSRVTYVRNDSIQKTRSPDNANKHFHQAYARDECFPISRYWSHVDIHTHTPVDAVWLISTIGTLLLPSHLRWRPHRRCDLQHRSLRSLCLLHHPHRHPHDLRRRQVSARDRGLWNASVFQLGSWEWGSSR